MRTFQNPVTPATYCSVRTSPSVTTDPRLDEPPGSRRDSPKFVSCVMTNWIVMIWPCWTSSAYQSSLSRLPSASRRPSSAR